MRAGHARHRVGVPRFARLLALLAALLLAAYGLGSRDGAARADLGWRERNVQRVARQVRVERAKAAAAVRETDRTARAVARTSARVAAAQDTLADVLADAHAALRDSAATIDTLRHALGRTVSAAHGLSLEVDTLRAAIAADARAGAAERAAHGSLIAAQAAVIAAQAKHLKALDCRVLGVRCPSRRAAFGAGALAALALAVLR